MRLFSLNQSLIYQHHLKLFISIIILLNAFAISNAQISTAEKIIGTVDPTVPPNGVNTTFVSFDLDFKQVAFIDENKMHLAIKLYQYTCWQDTRLAYANNKNVDALFKNSKLDISQYSSNVWIPKLSYTEENDIELIGETMYLYPNGTIDYYREIVLTFTCEFNYKNIPSDEHECSTIAYIQNEFNDTAYMTWVDMFPSSREIHHLTWDVDLSYGGNVNVRTKSDPTGVSTGIRMTFVFSRDPQFLTKIFVSPSIIFVVLAYITFWIDSRKAPARVIFVITNILNAISLLVSTNAYIPTVPYRTWLQNFLIWNLLFTVIPMIQFAILNASVISYDSRKKVIEDLVNELKAYASRTDNPDEAEDQLIELRKKASRDIRATITGGDVLQIEDFQIDLNSVKQKKRPSTEKNQLSPVKNASDTNQKPASIGSLASFNKIMKAVEYYVEKKEYKEEIQLRLNKIIANESSFLFGMTETIANNFDYIFRYLYAIAVLLMMSSEFIHQMGDQTGYSFLAAILAVVIIFFIALFFQIIQYRKKASNIDSQKAVVFYAKCKCFKSKRVLENYD